MRSSRPYVQLDLAVIEQARQMDLLSYLRAYEPNNLVRVGGNVYCTREHDSLKISNGKWFWWSRGIGGVSVKSHIVYRLCNHMVYTLSLIQPGVIVQEIALFECVNSLVPVSYTHLDVYKRQDE